MPLFQVGAALKTSDGYVVADRGNRRLVFFDDEGNLLRAQGQEGEGPGDYRTLSRLTRGTADSLIVWDLGNRRFTVVSGSGDLGRSFGLQTTDSVPFAHVLGAYADGSFLATGAVNMSGGRPQDGRQSSAVELYHFDADGNFLARAGAFPTSEMYFETLDRGFRVWPILFGMVAHQVAAGRRLLVAPSDNHELNFFTPAGDLRLILRRRSADRPVTPAARDAEIEQLISQEGGDSEALRAVLVGMDLPEYLPAFGRVFVDRRERVWIEEFEDPAKPPIESTWNVYDSAGLLVASALLPREFQPTDAGDGFILGIETDELGQESVVAFVVAPESLR